MSTAMPATPPTASVMHLYRVPGLEASQQDRLLERLKNHTTKLPAVVSLSSEVCFNVSVGNAKAPLSDADQGKLQWLLRETYEPENLRPLSFLQVGSGDDDDKVVFVEVGPSMNFETAWSSNAVSICHACGIGAVDRLERSRRFRFEFASALTKEQRAAVVASLFDRMTECVYEAPLESFDAGVVRTPTRTIPIMEQGVDALRKASEELGLAFDEWDFEFYTKLFREKMKRDPTDVECFDLAQSNSEHSRHWFFGGTMVIDGVTQDKTLFKMVKETNSACCGGDKGNSIIAFHDNSSAIRGFEVTACRPMQEEKEVTKIGPSRFELSNPTFHGILTCETHNFPCGIAPFQGAETGTGGRLRDVQATGTGAYVVAGTSSYCVGNLNIPGYELPWEDSSFEYPSNMATPLQIEVEASNGASDYGNKFGEPVVSGYTRSFGMRMPDGDRREWVKPIMMSAGVGILDSRHTTKAAPAKGMIVVKLGGPAYRIGMGGGAASSKVQDAQSAELDFNAVQRGDAEMENKMNRVIRACVELGDLNPIVSIHDQGAGGNGNVLKEISEPAGAELFLGRLAIGDKTMNAMELWGAEYQENNALLIQAKDKELFTSICERENLPYGYLGEITDTGRIVVHDAVNESETPVDLDLSDVLGDMPSKTFHLERVVPKLEPFVLPQGTDVNSCLDKVLRLLQVGSKRFLTNKVDRSVSGLVVQQPCVGPVHTPLADVAVVALTCFGDVISGVATAIGEQPIKGLVSTPAMARMSVSEALTNLVWAKITALSDVKCSGNWMWAAKLKGEGAAMYDACKAMRDVMLELGVAVDGGKDSLSMACSVNGEIVKCPGQLAISVYAMVPDVEKVVTPDLKYASKESTVLFLDLAAGKARMGGSALAQCLKQVGDTSPDLDDASVLKRAFEAVQELVQLGLISAGHDRSDGGLLVALLEMAFAGNCGLSVDVPAVALAAGVSAIEYLFAEELGMLVEVKPGCETQVSELLSAAQVPFIKIATTNTTGAIKVVVAGETVVDSTTPQLRDVWEATGFELGKFQCRPQDVTQEREVLKTQQSPPYALTYTPVDTDKALLVRAPTAKPRMAVLREEGTNGDREMSWAFFTAGFDVWDVTLADLRAGSISLDAFRGVAFAGGFSYADVMDSAKGWAGGILFNENVKAQFDKFRQRPDTFSLGVCNGCQLMALLGWVPGTEEQEVDWTKQARFVHNASEKYESRFPTVRIESNSRAMMFKGMEGSQLGIWVAHGEGRAHFPDVKVMETVSANGQAPLRYVDDAGETTEVYPHNPNGSPNGIAGLCSMDGRHLAMMPHPERVFKKFHWPYMPNEWTEGETALQASPWLKMFQNAYDWCESK